MNKKFISSLVGSICLVGMVQAGTTSYRNVVLGDNPIVYYEFDDTSGTTAVNSGSLGATHDGTIVSTVTLNQASFAQGGTAFDFGGGRVTAAAFSTLTEWTVEAWINWDSAKTSASNFFGNDQGGWNDDVLFGIGAEAGGQGVPASNVGLIQQSADQGTTRDVVKEPLTHSVWHHVVATGSDTAGEIKLYVDGSLVDTDSSLVNDATMNGHQFAVGAARFVNDAGTRPFDGLIDEFAIYSTVMDSATVLTHYTAGIVSAGTPPSISALSPADDASGVDYASDLVATFNQPLALTGNGTVTIRNLTLGSGSDSVISLPDTSVSVSGNDLTINPASDLDPLTSYAVWISTDAVEDTDGDAFAGISDDSTWNFTTAALPGLVGKWEFESEAGGVTPDSSGNGHDGTLEGNANLTTDAERGSVLELSGLGSEADRVNIDSTLAIPTLAAGRGATLAAWIKRNTDATAGDVFAYPIGLGTSGNFPIITIGIADATGFVRGFIEGDDPGGDQVEVDGDWAVSDGVWTHIAITYDRVNDEAISYVNGVPQGTPTDISIVGDGALDWGFGVIGRNVNGSGTDVNHFGGLVDDVCYYDKVLTPAEVQTLYNDTAASNTFASWISGFSVGGLTGFDDDFDLDGIGNGLENFFGTSPEVFSSGLEVVSSTSTSVTASHTQSNEVASDITGGYQWSTDLEEWKSSTETNSEGVTATISTVITDDQAAPANDTVEVTATITGGSTADLYLRVSVSLGAP